MEIKEILHKSPSSRWLRNGIYSLLSQANARGSALYVTHIDTVGQS